MYTRNQGNVRPTPVMRSAAPLPTERMAGGGAGDPGGMPILIPQDYHGEFLRGHRTSLSEMTEMSDTASLIQASEDMQAESADMPAPEVDAIPTVSSAAPDRETEGLQIHGHGTSLIGGLYDLLLGENSSEEETLLLLGIGLLLLWGHLDRGGLFDRRTWDGDDLALLLIGYLLLS